MRAMKSFLQDYEIGKKEGRYIEASLPTIPFSPGEFDIALCSHFLFLYSTQVSLELHIEGMRELCRVSKEVRVYPLITLEAQASPHLEPVIDAMLKNGLVVELKEVSYRFQKNA